MYMYMYMYLYIHIHECTYIHTQCNDSLDIVLVISFYQLFKPFHWSFLLKKKTRCQSYSRCAKRYYRCLFQAFCPEIATIRGFLFLCAYTEYSSLFPRYVPRTSRRHWKDILFFFLQQSSLFFVFETFLDTRILSERILTTIHIVRFMVYTMYPRHGKIDNRKLFFVAKQRDFFIIL